MDPGSGSVGHATRLARTRAAEKFAVARLGAMVDDPVTHSAPGDSVAPRRPGIDWEPGDEDYPFPALPGESAIEYVHRWLDAAGYARIDEAGVRFIHEADVVNLLNHVTADVDLLQARLAEFGDHVVVAADHAATVRRIEAAIVELGVALDTLQARRER